MNQYCFIDKLWISVRLLQISLTARKAIFSFSGAGIPSFLYYRERWYFFFPKIWPYTLDRKCNMIFLKKYTEIWYFLQIFWKYGLSEKCRAGTWSFLYYLERWYFFAENMIFFPWADSERLSFLGNIWKHDVSSSKKNQETWYIGSNLASP